MWNSVLCCELMYKIEQQLKFFAGMNKVYCDCCCYCSPSFCCFWGICLKKRVSTVVASMASMGRTFQSVIVLGRDECWQYWVLQGIWANCWLWSRCWCDGRGSSLSYGCGCAHRFLVNLVQHGCSWDLSALLYRCPPGSVLSILAEKRFVSEFTRQLPLASTLRRSLGLPATTFRGSLGSFKGSSLIWNGGCAQLMAYDALCPFYNSALVWYTPDLTCASRTADTYWI